MLRGKVSGPWPRTSEHYNRLGRAISGVAGGKARSSRNALGHLGAPLALVGALALAGCGDAAPPEPGEGAVGAVGVNNAGAGENPKTPALPGGPEGQTPAYGTPGGGAGSVVYSGASGAPSAGTPEPAASAADDR